MQTLGSEYNNHPVNIGGKTFQLFTRSPLPTLPDLSGDDWRDLASESYECEPYTVHAFDIGDGRFLHVDRDQGYVQNVAIDYNIESHLADYEYYDIGYSRLSLWLDAWGLDGLSTETRAPDGYDGECLIYSRPQYHHGHCNPPSSGLISAGQVARSRSDPDTRDDYDPRFADETPYEFSSRQDADEYVHWYFNAPSQYDGIPACNVLSHGQAGPDRLTVITL